MSKAGRSPGASTTPGLQLSAGDPRRVDTYLKADISPSTCFIVEDNGRRSVKKVLSAIRDAGGTLVYVLHTTPAKASEAARAEFPDVTHLDLPELIRPTLVTELSRSMTRARVQQYQRYFADADSVLILLHNDPDPDAMASGLALRNLLRRNKNTAIIGAVQGVTRPENLRMANMLDIHVEKVTPASFAGVRSDRHRRRAAALLRRHARPRRPRRRSPSGTDRDTARPTRTSAPTTDRRPRSSPSTCARST